MDVTSYVPARSTRVTARTGVEALYSVICSTCVLKATVARYSVSYLLNLLQISHTLAPRVSHSGHVKYSVQRARRNVRWR